ncbi:MFS transporter [Microterricola viridarii]|uniref:Predicted arabinose efflux permease, MFS family n=1 Tax=Microterricola viridarii TaxID=412690 RepID=A0A1H1LT62_9MICO|nr:MFS transporter [Microterricola viridarii]SDR77185.1 Predicted arabinose efflux permease, MFS family [Microterricola viridarii]
MTDATTPDTAETVLPAGDQKARFAAFRHPHARRFILSGTVAMMGDNIEHVISYWVMWQLFHSPLLAGFAVVSHWLPHLFLSVWFGGLADKYDCRRIIQIAQAAFITASLGWGVLFVAGILEPWHCCVLLVIHGLASAIWHPADQMMLYDIVGPKELPSAVRLNSTGRNVGMLLGPLVGATLLLTVGPNLGMFLNVLCFLPMVIVLIRMPYTGHTRVAAAPKVRLRLGEAFAEIARVRHNVPIMSMIVLSGSTSLLIGVALAPLMPDFAAQLGGANAGAAYSLLMAATAAGAVLGGVLLESSRRFRPTVRVAAVATLAYGLVIVVFALSHNYLLSLLALLVGGVVNLVSSSTAQTIVQLEAPPEERGRVIGLYGMASMGLRAGSGVTIGVLGAWIGIQWAVGAAGIALCLVAAVMLLVLWAKRVPAAPAVAG